MTHILSLQLDDESVSQLVSWLPSSLPGHIRVVISCIDNTKPHLNLVSRIKDVHEELLAPLSQQSRKVCDTLQPP